MSSAKDGACHMGGTKNMVIEWTKWISHKSNLNKLLESEQFDFSELMLILIDPALSS